MTHPLAVVVAVERAAAATEANGPDITPRDNAVISGLPGTSARIKPPTVHATT